jgi:hypothetical protein
MLADKEDQDRRQESASLSNTGPPIGRPKASVDIVAAERGASIGCTMEEIATLLG